MTALVPLAAATAGAEQLTFLQNLQFQAVGVMVVMTSLGGLAIVVAILAALLAPMHKPARAASAAVPQAAVLLPGEIPPEVRAVIAAAVHTVLKSPHRIVDVQPAANPLLQAWSMEGRRQIFQSHSFRR